MGILTQRWDEKLENVVHASCSPPIVLSVPSAGKNSVAVVDQIRAGDKKRFVHRAGILADADLRNLEMAAKQVLQLP